MNSENHTVTIPFSDYQRMKDALGDVTQFYDNATEHLILLFYAMKLKGNIGHIDMTKKPKNVFIINEQGEDKVRFEY